MIYQEITLSSKRILPVNQISLAFGKEIVYPTDHNTQLLEPILVPKLRIYFADFPYSPSSIDSRLLTLET